MFSNLICSHSVITYTFLICYVLCCLRDPLLLTLLLFCGPKIHKNTRAKMGFHPSGYVRDRIEVIMIALIHKHHFRKVRADRGQQGISPKVICCFFTLRFFRIQ